MLEEAKTPYDKVRIILDKRMSQALDQSKSWRMATIICLSMLAFSIMGNIYLGQKSKHIPYVVAVQSNGEANTLDAAVGLQGPGLNRAISFFLSRFVMLAREIPADPVLLRDNMGKLFQLVSSQGQTLLADKFKRRLSS